MEELNKRKKFIVNTTYFALIIAILYLVFTYVIGYMLPFIIGFIIAYSLNPLIKLIVKKTPLKRGLVASFLVLLIYLFLGFLAWLLISQLIVFGQAFLKNLPNLYENQIKDNILNFNTWVRTLIESAPPAWQSEIFRIEQSVITNIEEFIVSISKSGVLYLTTIPGKAPAILIAFLFTILASIFTSIEYPNVTNFIMNQLPTRTRILIREIKRIFVDTIFNFIRAYLKIMLITFAMLFIGFSIIGIENALLIAILIAIFDILPVLGTGGILIPWSIIALLQGNTQLALAIIIIYIIITVVRHLIEPKIIGDQLGLNPLVAITAIYVGFLLFGVMGMLITPIVTQIAIALHRTGKIKLFKEEVENLDDKVKVEELEKERITK